MKILVPLKQTVDPASKLSLQGDALDLSKATMLVNQFDEYALEAALRLVENPNELQTRFGEVIAVSIGKKEVEPLLKTALAMGADRAIWVDTGDVTLDSSLIAKILLQLVKKETIDLVLMGKLSADTESNEVGQRLSALWSVPQATFVSTIEVLSWGKTLRLGREVDDGIEYKRIDLPSVVTVDLRVIAPRAVQNGKTPAAYAYNEGPRYASLKGILAAKKKPLEVISVASFGLELKPLVETVKVELPEPRKAGVKVSSVKELVAKLKDEAKVL